MAENDTPKNYVEEVEDQVRSWSSRIFELKSKADLAPAEEKIGMLNQIADLTRRKDRLMVQAADLKKTENESWEQVKDAIEKEVADLDEAYRQAIRYFH
jgi:hypothetical protein